MCLLVALLDSFSKHPVTGLVNKLRGQINSNLNGDRLVKIFTEYNSTFIKPMSDSYCYKVGKFNIFLWDVVQIVNEIPNNQTIFTAQGTGYLLLTSPATGKTYPICVVNGNARNSSLEINEVGDYYTITGITIDN